MTKEEKVTLLDKLLEIEKKADIGNLTRRDRAEFQMWVKALEQEPKTDVLDKIRAEIDVARYFDKDTKLCKNANASGLEVAMQIIDKYKAESEGNNGD